MKKMGVKQGIYPECYFELAINDFPGNEALSKLYLDHSQDRVNFNFSSLVSR